MARGLSVVGGMFGVVGVICMIVVGTADSIGNMFNRPILASVEIIQAILAPAIFMSLGYAAMQGQHIKVDLFTEKLPLRARQALFFIGLVMTIAIFCFIAWLSWLQGLSAMSIREVSAGYIPIPIWISKVFISLGATIAAIECFRQLVWLCFGVDAIERSSSEPEDNVAAF